MTTCAHEHCRQPVMRCGQDVIPHRCAGWVHALTALHECLGGAGTTAHPALVKETSE